MKQNNLLKQEKRNTEQTTVTAIQNVKAEYQSKLYTLTNSQKEADQKLAEAENLKSRLSDEATKRANKMIEDKTSELQARFHAKETVMVSYVAIFGILTASVTVLSLIRQKTFWGDFRDFWIGFWNILVAAATLIGNGFSQIANLCDRIPQRYLAVIAHWIVLIGLVIGLGAFIGFGVVKLIKFYAEPILNGITPWNGSVSVIALAAVVFFGDYIKNILKFNLFGIWIILTVILIGLGIYLSYGKSNRGYY